MYQVNLTFKEPVGAYFRVEAPSEEEAGEKIKALLEGEGAVDVQVVEVVFVEDASTFRKGLN